MKDYDFRGRLFELFCRHLVELNGYKLVDEDRVNNKVVYHGGSTREIRIAGRGSNHQIDLPYDYSNNIPMLNPIRLIGEVKFYKDSYKVQIKHIRDLYGVLEDIKQNYFVSNLRRLPRADYRKSEQGVFISASGFTIEAQKFALAHNIKLLSFNNSPTLTVIKNIVMEITNIIFEMKKSRLINNEDIKRLLDSFYDERHYGGWQFYLPTTNARFRPIKSQLQILTEEINSFRSKFIGTTSKGHLMVFFSKGDFPIHLFDNNQVYCAIYYSYQDDDVDANIRMIIEGRYEYFSTLPTEIIDAFRQNHLVEGNAIREKYNYFSPITLIYDNRILKIIFDEFEFARNPNDIRE